MKKLGKNLFGVAIVCLLVLATFAKVEAAGVNAGYCGDPSVNSGRNVTWSLEDTGLLCISGYGLMGNYIDDLPPWCYYDQLVFGRVALKEVLIGHGVTSIGYKAFTGCRDLTTITIPNSIKSMGMYSFDGCDKLENVYFEGTEVEWKAIKRIDNCGIGKNNVNPTIHYSSGTEGELANPVNLTKPRSSMALNTSSILIQAGKTSDRVKAILVNDSIASVTSSNNDVASATFSGDTITVAAGKKAGKVTITVTSNTGIVRSFTVKVQKGKVATNTLTVSKKNVTLNTKGETSLIKVKVTPDAVSTGEPVIIKMEPAAKKVAEVEYDETAGFVIITAKATGTAKIKVCAGKKSEYIKATVKLPVNVKKVKLNKKKINFSKIGETKSLKAVITPSNSSNKKVTWKSSDTKVAKVNKNGKVTAVADGTATITVTTKDGNKTASCTVTVNAGKKKK